ncbi:hypothetical protein [Stenotrophomonas indicatrix]|uniref:hypothetical protein n=1 Tax=Stenotrophomonas indicatrix TaxID=2045451 RepID=UPI00289B596D|nr:hypothetical protein [Stenotrophomonas indicatrix]
MNSEVYSHLVEIDEETRILSIYRISLRRRELYTSVELPSGPCVAGNAVFDDFFKLLGENIVFDSPQGRRCLGLDDEDGEVLGPG